MQSAKDTIKEFEQQIKNLQKEIQQANRKVNLVKNEKVTKLNLQVFYSSLPKKEREKIKERIVAAYLYKHLATRYNELQDLYKKLQIAHDDLISRFVNYGD